MFFCLRFCLILIGCLVDIFPGMFFLLLPSLIVLSIRYCECFAAGIYCDGCNCLNCHNNVDNEVARQSAIGAILERNPNAFRPKVTSSPHESREGRVRNLFVFCFFLDFLEVAFICCQKYETFIYRIQRNYFNLYSLISLLLPFWELPYLCVVTCKYVTIQLINQSYFVLIGQVHQCVNM